MKFYENEYYHLYNRTNNEEALFRTRENYLFFLKKYRYYLEEYLDTIAYCLMPTHFHFLVRVRPPATLPSEGSKPSEGLTAENYSLAISRRVGTLLNSYTQAFNKMWKRHGNLFNQKTNAKQIADEKHYIALTFYIHQNPLRSKLVETIEDWEFSSYQDYVNLRKGSLPKKELILNKFKTNEIKEITVKPSEGFKPSEGYKIGGIK